MGWMEDAGKGVGDFFGNVGETLFGTKTAEAAKQNLNQATAAGAEMAENAKRMGQQYDQGALASMGANAGEYMQKANQAAQENAARQAGLASLEAMRQNIKGARTAGMNPAAAAARAGQQAGANYAGNYGQGVQQGVNQYMAGTQQFGQMGGDMANRQMAGRNIQIGGAGQQSQAAENATKNTMNTVQMALNPIGGLLGGGK